MYNAGSIKECQTSSASHWWWNTGAQWTHNNGKDGARIAGFITVFGHVSFLPLYIFLYIIITWTAHFVNAVLSFGRILSSDSRHWRLFLRIVQRCSTSGNPLKRSMTKNRIIHVISHRIIRLFHPSLTKIKESARLIWSSTPHSPALCRKPQYNIVEKI